MNGKDMWIVLCISIGLDHWTPEDLYYGGFIGAVDDWDKAVVAASCAAEYVAVSGGLSDDDYRTQKVLTYWDAEALEWLPGKPLKRGAVARIVIGHCAIEVRPYQLDTWACGKPVNLIDSLMHMADPTTA